MQNTRTETKVIFLPCASCEMPRRSARRCGFDVEGCNTYMVRHVPRHWQRRRTRFQRGDVAYYDRKNRKGKKGKRAALQQFCWLSKSYPGHVFTHKKSKKKQQAQRFWWWKRLALTLLRSRKLQNNDHEVHVEAKRETARLSHARPSALEVVGRSQNVIAVLCQLWGFTSRSRAAAFFDACACSRLQWLRESRSRPRERGLQLRCVCGFARANRISSARAGPRSAAAVVQKKKHDVVILKAKNTAARNVRSSFLRAFRWRNKLLREMDCSKTPIALLLSTFT